MCTALIRLFPSVIRRGLLPLCLLMSAQVGWAQEAPTSSDLRALQYYVQQNETAAISAELRRLQIAFPGWTPPEDLTTLQVGAPTTQIDTIYEQITRNDLAGARRTLSETQSAFPDWTPPDNMIDLIDTAEAQEMFDAAIARRDPDGALRIGLGSPELLRCSRINNTWQLAALEEASGNDAQAFAAYRQIVNSCSAISDVISTIEKADSVATEAQLRALISAAGDRLPGSRTTLEALQTRLLIGRGVMPGPTTAAAPQTTTAAPAPAPRAMPATPPQPAAKVSAPVATPPQQSIAARRPASSPLSGLRSSGDSRIGQVRAASQAADFRSCAARSANPQSLDVAYERAWCVYNLERPLEALALFTAASTGGMPGTTSRDARYGMALSLLKRQMTDAASRIAAATDFDNEQRRTVESIILDQRGVRAYQQENYTQAIKYLNGLEALDGTLRRDLAFLRGYAYLNGGHRAMARAQFQRLHDELATSESRAALSAVRPPSQTGN